MLKIDLVLWLLIKLRKGLFGNTQTMILFYVAMNSQFKSELQSLTPLLSVGIISANIMKLAEAEAELFSANVKLVHFDIMDGRFCPQITVGPFFVKGLSTRMYKDVHLMVDDPIAVIPDFAKAGADIITVHAEAGRHIHRALQLIGEQKNANDPSRGILRGIALNPQTPVSSIERLLDETDLVCLLAVNPGFAGQSYIESTAGKFLECKNSRRKTSSPPLICIDGGITAETMRPVAAYGADIIVSGSAVFRNGAISQNISGLNELMRRV